jgi:hypothetical protein
MARLSKSDREKLLRVVASADFDSDAAVELDGAIMESLPDDVDYDTLEPLDDAQAGFFACWWLEGEVNNGGFHQFFLNKGAVVAREALRFCKANDLKPVADILDRAIDLVDRSARVSLEAINEWLADEANESMEKLSPLDDEFFELDPYPAFIAARLRHAQRHATSFFE